MLTAAQFSAQDLEYPVRSLVEGRGSGRSRPASTIRTRPSAWIDRLGAGLCEVAEIDLERGVFVRDGKVVLVVPSVSYDGLVEEMYGLIRQNAAGSAAVLRRMLEVLTVVLSVERRPGRVEVFAAPSGRDPERRRARYRDAGGSRPSPSVLRKLRSPAPWRRARAAHRGGGGTSAGGPRREASGRDLGSGAGLRRPSGGALRETLADAHEERGRGEHTDADVGGEPQVLLTGNAVTHLEHLVARADDGDDEQQRVDGDALPGRIELELRAAGRARFFERSAMAFAPRGLRTLATAIDLRGSRGEREGDDLVLARVVRPVARAVVAERDGGERRARDDARLGPLGVRIEARDRAAARARAVPERERQGAVPPTSRRGSPLRRRSCDAPRAPRRVLAPICYSAA